jgi:hypothetical protein
MGGGLGPPPIFLCVFVVPAKAGIHSHLVIPAKAGIQFSLIVG